LISDEAVKIIEI